MYNIGLDIGTGSVGWCLTDNNGHLLKINRKGDNGKTYRNSAWGVRLFESANTAADCRIKRSTRRRYNRRRTRIIELRKIMSDMIMPIDPNFYARLDEAFLWNEDKSDKAKAPFLLFNDNGYDDVKYYTDYPTIYHLRKHLLEMEGRADARLIYLALHHMMKYRGHFLFEGQSFEAIDNIEDTFIELEHLVNVYVKEKEDTDNNSKNNALYQTIKNYLADNKVKNKDKKEDITDTFIKAGYDNKYSKELAAAVLGYEFNMGIIVNDNNLTDENGKVLSEEEIASLGTVSVVKTPEDVTPGHYTIKAQVENANKNYDITCGDRKFDILARPITIKTMNMAIEYGDDVPDVDYYISDMNGELADPAIVSGADFPSLDFSIEGQDEGKHLAASTTPYAINVSGLDNANFKVTYEGGSLTVNPRKINISIDSKKKVEDDADPELTYTVSRATGEAVAQAVEDTTAASAFAL